MEIFFSEKLRVPNKQSFQKFIQAMASGLMQGFARYGGPDAGQLYLTRLKRELRAYDKTGNQEHLINIANYCHLEMYAPEHEKAHHDPTARSVTRGYIKKRSGENS